MSYYEELVNKWAENRGIFDSATPASQFEKTLEEVGELARGLIEKDFAKIEDAIGDVVVTLIILAKMNNTSLEVCLTRAYNQIAQRKGKMIDGVFVKEA